MSHKIIYLLIALIISATSTISAQSINSLKAQKKKALNELAVTNRLLKETRKDKKGTENKISLLKRSINQSTEYINTLNQELSLLDSNIDSIQTSKNAKEAELEKLREDYAKTTRAIYAHHKYFSPLVFIISAKNFNQAYRRFRYLQQIASHRKAQVEEIKSITDELAIQHSLLTESRTQKGLVMDAKTLEQERLESQKKEQAEQLSSIKQKEAQLKAQQRKQQRKADQLNRKIQDMIAAEIRRQKEADVKAAKKQGKKDQYELSKEEKLVAGNFEANKGRLPRPIEKGFISGHFGVQPHPVLKKVTINNKGIYFQVPAGSDARAVFSGVVTQCFSVPGSNQSVIIKHGNYRTVYSNIVTLYVKVGDKVNARQKIGKIYTDKENDNKTELYFMLYKDTSIQNPEYWLAK